MTIKQPSLNPTSADLIIFSTYNLVLFFFDTDSDTLNHIYLVNGVFLLCCILVYRDFI